MKSYGKLTAALIAAWFALVVSAAALQLFTNAYNRVGVAVGLAALIPIVAFMVWYGASEGFRHFALSLSPRILTYVQSWRIIGLVFVILEARNVLPAIFALPAGYGDMAIGVTASFVAWKLADPGHRNGFILWQGLGMADLVLAVSLGTTAPFLSPQSIPMAAMTVLPLSVIPTFLVPLFLILHMICIAQARRWKAVPSGMRQTSAGAPNFAVSGFQTR
jgi:hypothetical protein